MSIAVKTGLWHLDQTTSTVAIRHKTIWGMVTVNGTFTPVAGDGEVLPDGSARGTLTLDAASLDTKHAKRDKHLRSADFFDTENYPTISFTAERLVLSPDGTAQVTGQLTVRGVSRTQTLTATVNQAKPDEVVLDAEFIVDRDQFGLSWNQLGMLRGLTTVTTSLRFIPVSS
jgi:polyisoprenoid-binding protein YceI